MRLRTLLLQIWAGSGTHTPVAGTEGDRRSRSEPPEKEVMLGLDAFLDGCNSRNVTEYASALHFPHLILRAGRYREFPDRDRFTQVAATHWEDVPAEWDHTIWNGRQIVQRHGDTVHVVGRWEWIDGDGNGFEEGESLYVLVRQGGSWKVFTRSEDGVLPQTDG